MIDVLGPLFDTPLWSALHVCSSWMRSSHFGADLFYTFHFPSLVNVIFCGRPECILDGIYIFVCDPSRYIKLVWLSRFINCNFDTSWRSWWIILWDVAWTGHVSLYVTQILPSVLWWIYDDMDICFSIFYVLCCFFHCVTLAAWSRLFTLRMLRVMATSPLHIHWTTTPRAYEECAPKQK